MVEINIGGRLFRLRELTFGDLLAIIEAGTENIFDPSGNVRQVVNARKISSAILKHCVDSVVESGVARKLNDQELLALPAQTAIELIEECRKINPFLSAVRTS